MCDVSLNYILFVWACSCQGCARPMDSIFVRASERHGHKSAVSVYFMYTLRLMTVPVSLYCKAIWKCFCFVLFFLHRRGSAVLNCISVACTNTSSSHPPFAILNKHSSSSSSHSTTFYLCCTWEMRERGGDGSQDEWNGEWGMKESRGWRGERREQDWEKCPLTGFKSLWHFIFRERGASSPSDPLRANLID